MFNSDEYKVMGLAAYGDSHKYAAFFEDFMRFDDETGQILVCWPQGTLNAAEEGYPGALFWIHSSTGLEPRHFADEVTQEHADFAASLQKRFSEMLCDLARWWLRRSGHSLLCLAGGVFLNCRANQLIASLEEVEDIFIQPASGDDGSALGAGLAHSHAYKTNDSFFSPYLGPEYTLQEIQDLIAEPQYKQLSFTTLGYTEEYFASAAQAIRDDFIIAWFSGRMEFGPRALGNRSILALPSGKEIKERINRTVKFREGFRPFAPAVTDE